MKLKCTHGGSDTALESQAIAQTRKSAVRNAKLNKYFKPSVENTPQKYIKHLENQNIFKK